MYDPSDLGSSEAVWGYRGLQTWDCWPTTTYMIHIKKFPSSLMDEVAVEKKFEGVGPPIVKSILFGGKSCRLKGILFYKLGIAGLRQLI